MFALSAKKKTTLQILLPAKGNFAGRVKIKQTKSSSERKLSAIILRQGVM